MLAFKCVHGIAYFQISTQAHKHYLFGKNKVMKHITNRTRKLVCTRKLVRTRNLDTSGPDQYRVEIVGVDNGAGECFLFIRLSPRYLLDN